MGKIVAYRQLDGRDCGPTCLRIIANFYGRKVSLEKLLHLSETTREGSSIKNITDAAQHIGFKTMGVRISYQQLQSGIPLPCIIFWQQRHFVVVYKIKKDQIWIADPAHGKIKIDKNELLKNWIGNEANDEVKAGITLLLEPTLKLKIKEMDDVSIRLKLSFLWKYLFIYKRLITQLFVGLLAASLLQLMVPFLTQSIVDVGLQNFDLNFVYLVLIAQLGLFLGRVSIELIRGWIVLHLSTRINIALVSDFFIKLMDLPISFFDSKVTGDLMQRIKDHSKIQKLLTSATLDTFFSFINILVFGFILAWYHLQIFYVFFIGSSLYFIWIFLFLEKRKDIDYKRFTQLSSEQGKIMELVNGMQDIKLNNAEQEKRWGWEYLQTKLFKIDLQNLALQQSQAVGATIINEVKNIFITFLAAKLVIDGELTLGMMIAVAYIIGQLNGPIQQLIGFVYTLQDAKIALERLAQIHNKKDEKELDETKIRTVLVDQEISAKNISYRYQGALKNVFTDLSFSIPPNKITAIVGASGSGKSTLLKILLKFYEVSEGELFYGDNWLSAIEQKVWRAHCGVVMQEGYIFNDTIANNITIGDNKVSIETLNRAVELANLSELIRSLPRGLATPIGSDGIGLSTGQKQRILIARAIYKNPEIILFDEATSALDTANERQIMENLNLFFKQKTVVIIAHRLSTVRNADQIIVLESGKIQEVGTHQQLIENKKWYYNLVKNQLDLEQLNDNKQP